MRPENSHPGAASAMFATAACGRSANSLVAVDGAAVVGFVTYVLHANTTRLAPSCYLQDLFTRPDQRGRGIARSLIEGVATAARAAGADRVYWHTQESNHQTLSLSLYDSIGVHSGFIVYAIEL